MNAREENSFGIHGVTPIDRLGVWLSKRAILRHLAGRRQLDAIEFGCGYRAAQLMALRDRLRQGVGVDFRISKDLFDVPNMKFYEGSIESVFPILSPALFDLVLFISVIEHLIDPLAVLKSAFTILKPDGILLINVPTWRGKFFLEFSAFSLGLSPSVEMNDHKMYYDKRDLWPLLVQAGFKPSLIRLSYHKFGLNLFAVATKTSCD